MDEIIKAEGLSYSYTGASLFSDVSFSLKRGEFAALTGINGSGKSTLMRIILGDLPPRSGSVRLFGGEGAKTPAKIGYLPQNDPTGLGFPATALEAVSLSLYSSLKFPRFIGPAAKARAMDALRLTGMEDYAGQMLSQMSGGERQRIMLSRTLAASPELLLLDEPTTGVDSESIISLFDLLRKLCDSSGYTVLMVTHDLEAAARVIDYALCLEHGSMIRLDREALHEELSHRHIHPPKEA